ncbi:MAG: SDR family NAD(P)-dependent oxidoreductase [Clostridia bacterium]|nr:SDR family NAD(P)-dependent oxidoreductase [Clostridia bacterium]
MKTIAIVTGASSGIGKEFFLSLLKKDEPLDEIWVVARSEENLKALQPLSPLPLRIFALDLSKTESTAVLIAALQAENPCVKYLICASGFGRFSAVEDDKTAVLENMIDLNCRSIVSVTKSVCPYLKKGSLVILIASVAAFQPIPYIATYGASKAFVLSYGRAFNRELRKKRGARCLCVCPFWTKTAFFDRAKSEDTIVKKYAVMYEPKQIVTRAWKDAKKKNRDVSVFGLYTRGQRLLVKLLPHRLVMRIWLRQQKLN